MMHNRAVRLFAFHTLSPCFTRQREEELLFDGNGADPLGDFPRWPNASSPLTVTVTIAFAFVKFIDFFPGPLPALHQLHPSL